MKKILFGLGLAIVCTLGSVYAFSFDFGSQAQQFAEDTVNDAVGGVVDNAVNNLGGQIGDIGGQLGNIGDIGGQIGDIGNQLGGIGDIGGQIGDIGGQLGGIGDIGGQLGGIGDIGGQIGGLAGNFPGISSAKEALGNIASFKEPFEVVKSGIDLDEGIAQKLAEEVKLGDKIIEQGRAAIAATQNEIGDLKIAQLATEKAMGDTSGFLAQAKSARDRLLKQQGNLDQSLATVEQDINAALAEVKQVGTEAGFANITNNIEIPDAPKNSFINPIAQFSQFLKVQLVGAPPQTVQDALIDQPTTPSDADTGQTTNSQRQTSDPVPTNAIFDDTSAAILRGENPNDQNQNPILQEIPILQEDINAQTPNQNHFNIETGTIVDGFPPATPQSALTAPIDFPTDITPLTDPRDEILQNAQQYADQNIQTPEGQEPLSDFELVQQVQAEQTKANDAILVEKEINVQDAGKALLEAEKEQQEAQDNLDTSTIPTLEAEKAALIKQRDQTGVTESAKEKFNEQIAAIDEKLTPLTKEQELQQTETEQKLQKAALENELQRVRELKVQEEERQKAFDSCKPNCPEGIESALKDTQKELKGLQSESAIQAAITKTTQEIETTQKERTENKADLVKKLEETTTALEEKKAELKQAQNDLADEEMKVYERDLANAEDLATVAQTPEEKSAAAQAKLEAAETLAQEQEKTLKKLEEEKAKLEVQKAIQERDRDELEQQRDKQKKDFDECENAGSADCASLKQALEQTETELETANRNIEQTQNDLTTNQTDRNKYDPEGVAVEKLEQEQRNLQEEKTKREADIKALEAKKKKLEAELNNCTQDCEAKKAALQITENQITQQQKNLKDIEDDLVDKQEEIDTANDAKKAAEQSKEEAIKALEKETQDTHRAALESTLASAEADLAKKENELKTLQEQRDTIQAQLNDCQNDSDCISQQRAALAEVNNQIDDKENEIKQAEKKKNETNNGVQTERLKQEIEAYENIQDDIDQLEKTRAQARQNLQDAQRRLQECEDAFATDCETQRRTVQNIENQIANIDENLDQQYQLINEKNAGKIPELKQAMDKVEDLYAERDRIKKDLEEQKELLAACDKDGDPGCVTKHQQEIDALKGQLQTNADAIKTAENTVKTLQADIKTARDNIMEAKKKLAQYNCEYLDFTNEDNQSIANASGYCVQLSHNAHIGDVKSIRGENGLDLFSQYVGVLYRYAASIVGIIAVLIIVISGVQISMAGINSELASSAKTRIFQALLSLVLLFLIGMILRTVNPTFFT